MKKAKALWLLSLIFLAGLFVAARADDESPAAVGSVEAFVLEGPLAIEQPGVEADEAKHRSRFPEDPGLYVPMPIPDPTKKPVTIGEPESKFVTYNLLTGEELVSDIEAKGLPLEAWVSGGFPARASVTNDDSIQPRNFTDLQWVSNQEDYPWCVNVKLFMQFGSSWYVGSGVLIDPLHVLTAGHCVHDVLNGGTWADEIVVVPAYENGFAPYGTATAVNLYTWEGWIDDADWDHDMGIIDLDRPVGALTGWHGYGWRSDLSFFCDNTFHNPGYPAASPYNGQYMYYWYGDFDECPAGDTSFQVKFNKLSYGGQSGSGAYRIVSDNRYVYAELSNGTDTWTRDVCITENKFTHIGDIIGDDTPSDFDLIPLDVRISPTLMFGGAQLSNMDYVVHNYSTTSWSGNVTVKVYLSDNDNISVYDTLIQTHYFSYDFSPKSSVRVHLNTPPTIPAGTTAGDYWVGVILDISDHDEGNNDSDGQDARAVTVGSPTAAVFRVGSNGNLFADGPFSANAFLSGAADIAEWVSVSEAVEAGDVLELDPTKPGQYRKSLGPCSTLVAGVISTDPGFVLGGSATDDSLPTTHAQALLALVGIVPVKVTDESGPIEPGDLLVASSTPGYAMRWDPDSGEEACGLIGKALERFANGTGMMQVLLMR